MPHKEIFLFFIETALNQLKLQRQIAVECEVEESVIELHDKIFDHCSTLKKLVTNSDLSINCTKQFQDKLDKTLDLFPYRKQENIQFIHSSNKAHLKEMIERNRKGMEQSLTHLLFDLDFFEKMGFLNNNIVAIGANGSGKTSLAAQLKAQLQNNSIIISAQRILLVPTFETLSSPINTADELKNSQRGFKANKYPQDYDQLHQEFGVVLKNLLADNIAAGNAFRINAKEQIRNHDLIANPPITNLDRTLEIWNSLVEKCVVTCIDGMNIKVESDNVESYPALQMSDGEKVMLFLIAQVLQAPDSGFIIIDEPEMYLHKTILKKIWDILEKERHDCIFVYLTHDLDFATSRTTAKKIWVRSFTFPNKWNIENIPDNDLPESLLLELLGSSKNILFCESKKEKIDGKIYSILFPYYTVTPVNSCFDVINYTKAFNKLSNITTKAFGIIDSDHNGVERLKALESFNIFSFQMTEIENLLFDEDFLKLFARHICFEESTEDIIEKIKSAVISQLGIDLELQISNYVSAKINYYFKESHVSKGNTFHTVNENYNNFTNEIKIQEWYEIRKVELEEIIVQNDYSKVLSVYNNKGLRAIANRNLKISDFTERAIKFLQFQPETHEFLIKYFPEELKKKNNI